MCWRSMRAARDVRRRRASEETFTLNYSSGGAMKRLVSGLAFGLLVVALACCQAPSQPGSSTGEAPAATGPSSPDQVKKGGTLRGTWSGTLAHLDMHQVGVLGTWNAGNLMYNGLI